MQAFIYTASSLDGAQTSSPGWAVVIKGRARLTDCIQAERQGNEVVYTLKDNSFRARRRILAIENSLQLSKAGRGKAIQDALITWLSELKRTKQQLPLNLFRIHQDGELSQLIRGEELERLSYTSQERNSPSIVGLMNENFFFQEEGFQPLKNMTALSRLMADEEIASVIYFTDSAIMPEPMEASQLGALLGWKLDGVSVLIVTNGECERWRYKVPIVECINIDEYPSSSQIEDILNSLGGKRR